jgi:mono/diheme cytochrome c family protein
MKAGMTQCNVRGRRSRPLLYLRPHALLVLAAFLLVARAALAQEAATDQDQAKIAAGETIYNTNCAICHGDQLVNTGQTFDLRRLKADERPRFENSVRNGKNQMPPWKGMLSDNDIDRLWHYIRANAYQK